MTETARLVAPFALAAWSIFAFAIVGRIERKRFGSTRAPHVGALLAVSLTLVEVALAPQTFLVAAIVTAAVAGADVDARRGLLFDAVTLPMCALALASALPQDRTDAACIGGALFGGTFATIYLATRGRAIGLGDVKLLFVLGIAFGPFSALLGVLAACASGIVAVGAARLRGVRTARRVPFGPHLAFGALVALIAGPTFVHSYLRV